MAKTKISNEQEKEIVIDYIENNMGIYPICEKYHIGKIKLKEILQKNNITKTVSRKPTALVVG